uniref:Uncharacterized protein n=1 Tax=Tetraselmis sp. GSL018 TaxID=582737 RepID=A0A061R1G4_9CHLO
MRELRRSLPRLGPLPDATVASRRQYAEHLRTAQRAIGIVGLEGCSTRQLDAKQPRVLAEHGTPSAEGEPSGRRPADQRGCAAACGEGGREGPPSEPGPPRLPRLALPEDSRVDPEHRGEVPLHRAVEVGLDPGHRELHAGRHGRVAGLVRHGPLVPGLPQVGDEHRLPKRDLHALPDAWHDLPAGEHLRARAALRQRRRRRGLSPPPYSTSPP